MKRFCVLISALLALNFHASAQGTNRTLLMNLVATNFIGQNVPAIQATEAQYMEMWAEDVAALSGANGGANTVPSSVPDIFSPLTLTIDYSNSQSSFAFTSGSIPTGVAGYELTVNLRSSTANLQFDAPEPIDAFDLENDFTLVYSDGANTSIDSGTVGSYYVGAVPEPSTWAMLLCGAVALVGFRRRNAGRPA